jgi:hypothetical protein
LNRLRNEVRTLTEAQKIPKSKLDITTYKTKVQALKKEMRSVGQSISEIKAVDNSIGHLIKAIDPMQLEKIAKLLYAGFLVGIAGLKDSRIAKLSMGSTIGAALSNVVEPALNTTLNKIPYSRWAKQSISAVTTATGVALVHFYGSLGPSIACSTIASQIIPISSILGALGGLKLLGNIARDVKTPEIKLKSTDVATLQTALVYRGVALQMTQRDLPSTLRICFAPLEIVESMLKNMDH